MYSQIQKGPSHINVILMLACPVCAILMFAAAAAVPSPWKHFVIAGGIFILLGGIFIVLRLQVREFVYEIEEGRRPGMYDFTVKGILGWQIARECRFTAAGTVTRISGKGRMKPPKGTKVYRLCQLIPGKEIYRFDPDEAEGEYSILFCPDEEMLIRLQALGVNVIK